MKKYIILAVILLVVAIVLILFLFQDQLIRIIIKTKNQAGDSSLEVLNTSLTEITSDGYGQESYVIKGNLIRTRKTNNQNWLLVGTNQGVVEILIGIDDSFISYSETASKSNGGNIEIDYYDPELEWTAIKSNELFDKTTSLVGQNTDILVRINKLETIREQRDFYNTQKSQCNNNLVCVDLLDIQIQYLEGSFDTIEKLRTGTTFTSSSVIALPINNFSIVTD